MSYTPNKIRSIKLHKKNKRNSIQTSIKFPSTPEINFSILKSHSRASHTPRVSHHILIPTATIEEQSCISIPANPPAHPPDSLSRGIMVLESAGVSADCGLIIPNSELNNLNLSDNDLNSINSRVFHNTSFKETQLEAIKAVLTQKHVMVCCRTGIGKSLIYQLSGYVLPGITLVIMPLVSLICEQYKKLQSLGIPSSYFYDCENLSDENQKFHQIVIDKSIKFLFMTPEKLQTPRMSKLLKELHAQNRLDLMVIDEFHCIITFNEFRPKYQSIGEVITMYPGLRVLCLSGSIRPLERQQIEKNLRIGNPKVFISSPTRDNLFYKVIAKGRDYTDKIIELINTTYKDKTGIIYCSTIKHCKKLNSILQTAGVSCDYFCGGNSMDNNEREDKRKKWQSGGIKVMVSTTAFGMGIDNKNVRFVFHADLPKSITDYYQGTGRAGRDGQRSDVILFYKFSDRKTLVRFIHSCASDENKANSFVDLYNLIEFCEEELRCRKVMIAEHFEGKVGENCGYMCDNCLRRNSCRIQVFEKDFFNEVKIVLDLVRRRSDWTFRKLENALTDKGYNRDSAVRLYPEFGKLKDIQSLPRLLNKMLEQNLIREEAIDTMRAIKSSTISNIVSYLKAIDGLPQEKLHLMLTSGKYSMSIEVISLDSDLEIVESESLNEYLDDDVILITELPSKRGRENS